ncbi:MAG: plasmid pRiA4b ORF-3 family protein [Bacteroidota bacterium]
MKPFEISQTFPSPVLKDFHTFLHYFLSREVKTTAAGYLPGKVCFELNEKMEEPIENVTNRSRHIHVPRLYFFYHLAVNGKLLQKNRKGKTTKIKPDLDRVDEFFDLTDTEQYISLLEILWVHSDWEAMNDQNMRRSPAFAIQELLNHIASLNQKTVDPDMLRLSSWVLWPFAEYFRILGWWEIGTESTTVRQMYFVRSCQVSPFGKALCKIFAKDRTIEAWNPWEDGEEDSLFAMMNLLLGEDKVELPQTKEEIPKTPKEPFFKAFTRLFPSGTLTQTLTFHAQETVRSGNYYFKVSFKYAPKIWRRIVIAATSSLHDLHQIIQLAIDFDDDHLYAFYLDNKLHSRRAYNHPWSQRPPYADDITLGELPIDEGHLFMYYFDFGDSWEFEVVLEKIEKDKPAYMAPQVLESKGEAPEQYPDYEEEW